MLYHSNVILNVFLLIITSVFVVHYIINLDFFFWSEHNCGEECFEQYFGGPPKKSKDPTLLAVIRDEFLDPPPQEPNREPFDIYEPVWRKLVDWYIVQENLKEIWEDQAPGVFVEVGAVDGEFMSQTLLLEKNLSWTGLLIEPDHRSYAILRERKRNAWTSPLCVRYGLPISERYWLRDLNEELPEHFIQLLMARSKLNQETLTGDEERGSTTWVKCVALSSLLHAANMTSVDLLTIATGVDQDEKRIRDVLHNRLIDVKSLLIHYPTGRLFKDPYPGIRGYILDMQHSTLLVKFYVKKSHCKLIAENQCQKIHYYDVHEACVKYLCFDFLTVWAEA